MKGRVGLLIAAGALVFTGAPAFAQDVDSPYADDAGPRLQPYLQCVPYARQVSGIQIYGDAWTWWDQAAGRYARGHTPRVGAVMAFQPYGNMRLGHVAAVSQVIDSRTVLLRHANWSPIDGRRGQIEDNVEAVDVSPNNDWSQVRVWYAPIDGLGTTAWPVEGFIYPNKLTSAPLQIAAADAPAITPSRAFLRAFDDFDTAGPARESLTAKAHGRESRGPVDLLAQVASN
ncbi:MAG TPA: CHAP domain-containing protein [Acetobacteraceae bacterium]|nr:CHAP domain-containing protein [Acetobacteraceae bacterium]